MYSVREERQDASIDPVKDFNLPLIEATPSNLLEIMRQVAINKMRLILMEQNR